MIGGGWLRTFSRLVLLGALGVGSAYGYDPKEVTLRAHETPRELQGIGITEKLGQDLDLSTSFVDDQGAPVQLAKYFGGTKPVLLTIVYYTCPSLCNLHLNGVTEALRELKWTVGREFELVAVSMDARETAEVAAAKKANYIKSYGRPESASGWHFLTGSAASIQRLADEIGFGFRWDEQSQQFAHASAAVIVTPEGKVSRYLHGIQLDPKTLRLALVEAAGGKVGSLVDQFVMFCFKFNPQKSKYTIAAWNIMRVGVVLTVILMAIFLIPAWLRGRNQQGAA